MRHGNLAILFLLLGASLGAGCMDGGHGKAASTLPPDEQAALATGVGGRVLDEEQVPVVNAAVWLLTDGRFVRTDEAGRYEFRGLEAGDHLLSVEQYGFAPLTYRVTVWKQILAELDFFLKSVPVGEPYHETFPLDGLIACDVAIGSVPEDTQYFDCGANVDGVQEPAQWHDVQFSPGARRVFSELDWEPTVPTFKKLTLGLGPPPEASEPQAYSADPFNEVQGPRGISVVVVGWVLDQMYPHGGVLRSYVRASPIDEHEMYADAFQHPPISVGISVQQRFNMYTTVFYFSGGSPGFTALP